MKRNRLLYTMLIAGVIGFVVGMLLRDIVPIGTIAILGIMIGLGTYFVVSAHDIDNS